VEERIEGSDAGRRTRPEVERGGVPKEVNGVPPHCDSMDGPVVKAAIEALHVEDVDLVLPYVQEEGEQEVRGVFDKVVRLRKVSPEAKEVADRHFFETVVRVHRAGEGAPFTGLKPAGLEEGPIIPVAEEAVATGSPDELSRLLGDYLYEEVKERFDQVMELQNQAPGSVSEAREYVEAMLGLEVWSHKLYLAIKADPWGTHASQRHG
jgi:hypothetical protein